MLSLKFVWWPARSIRLQRRLYRDGRPWLHKVSRWCVSQPLGCPVCCLQGCKDYTGAGCRAGSPTVACFFYVKLLQACRLPVAAGGCKEEHTDPLTQKPHLQLVPCCSLRVMRDKKVLQTASPAGGTTSQAHAKLLPPVRAKMAWSVKTSRGCRVFMSTARDRHHANWCRKSGVTRLRAARSRDPSATASAAASVSRGCPRPCSLAGMAWATSALQGGQRRVSESAAELPSDSLPAGASLVQRPMHSQRHSPESSCLFDLVDFLHFIMQGWLRNTLNRLT